MSSDGVDTSFASVPSDAGAHVIERLVATPVNGSYDLNDQAASVPQFMI